MAQLLTVINVRVALWNRIADREYNRERRQGRCSV